MAKRVNKSLVGAMTGAVFLATTVAGVLMIQRLRQTDPNHYVKRAEQHAGEKDWGQAKMYYLRAYNVSKDPSYLVVAGEMLYEQGHELEAQVLWNRAITVDPSLVEAHEKVVALRTEVARTYRIPSTWVSLKETATKLLEVDAENANGLYALGLALIELPSRGGADDSAVVSEHVADPKKGLEHIRRAVKLAPEVVEYAITLARYLHWEGSADEAETLLTRLADGHSSPGADAVRVRFTLGRLLGADGKHHEAVAMFEESLTLVGDDPEVLAEAKSRFAQYWTSRWYRMVLDGTDGEIATGYYTKARSLLEESINIDESGFTQYMLLAELFAYKNERLKAIEVCERRINKPIRREGLRYQEQKFARYMLLLKAADECLAHSASLEKNSPASDELIAKAERFAVDAEAEFPDRGPGLHTMGKIRLARGQELDAISLFERAAKAYGKPTWLNSKLLAQLLARQGRSGAAKRRIEEAISDPAADPTCWVVYAGILFQNRDDATAIQMADKALQTLPGNHEALLVKIQALTRLGQTELAEQIRSTQLADSTDHSLLRIDILKAEGKTEEAIAMLARLLDADPSNYVYLKNAVRLLTEQNEHDRALTLVRKAQTVAPDDLAVRILATVADKTLSAEQRSDAQRAILESIPDPLTRSYRLAIWYGNSGMRAKYIAALTETERLLDAPGNSVDPSARRNYLRDILERQFVHATATNDGEQVERIVTRAIAENIDGADGQTYRGRQHMHAGRSDLALIAFKLAIQKQPTDARALAYVGGCHLDADPPQILEARTYFQRAVAADPNSGVAQKGLAIIARHRGDEREFALRMTECERLIPSDKWVRNQLLAQRELQTPLEGIDRRVEIRKREPDNVTNLLRLADLYARTRQNTEALEAYDAAIAVDKPSRSTIIAATRFMRGIGQEDRALRVLEHQVDAADGDSEKANLVLLIYAHWHASGDVAKAEEALRRAADYEESRDVCTTYAAFKTMTEQYSDALEWYDRAIKLAEEASPEVVASLRRNRIDVHFRADDHDAARREIDDYLRRYPEDPNGLLLQTAIDSVQGRIDAAIASLTRYLEKRPEDLRAVLQCAKLYGAQGRWVPAISHLEKLRGVDPGYRNYGARILLADGYALTHRIDLAFRELEAILTADPRAKTVATHLVDLYQQSQRYSDAERVCTSMANRFPDEPAWVALRADLRMKLRDPRAALTDYQAAATLSDFEPTHTATLLRAYTVIRQYNEGVIYFEGRIPQDKRAPEAVLRYGQLLGLSGKRDRAVQSFLAALHANGLTDFGFIRKLTGAITISCGDREAVDLFRQTPKDTEMHRVARHILALLLNHFREDSEALAVMHSLFDTATDDAEKTMLLAEMGMVHERREDWDGARKTYEDLLTIDDGSLIGLNNLAYLLSDKLNQPRLALPYAERASVIHRLPVVRDTLAWTHVQLGEYRKAIAVLTRLLEENPRYVPAMYHLGEAYRRDGDLERARTLVESALNVLGDSADQTLRDRLEESLDEIRNSR